MNFSAMYFAPGALRAILRFLVLGALFASQAVAESPLVTVERKDDQFTCVSAADVTDTNAATLCAADADEIYVVTDACCYNTDTAVATIVHLQDETGPTVFHDFFLPPYIAAAPGDTNECQTFPNGVKMAAVNKAIQILNVTNSAQVRCVVHGYKEPS